MTTSSQVGRERPQEREQRLLDAARQVLHARGFEADIRDILKVAAVGTGTAYRHFPNKEALVRAVIDEMRTRVLEGLVEAARVDDARGAIAHTMQVGFRALEEYGQLCVALFAGTEPPEYRGAVNREGLESFFAVLLRRGIEQGHFRADLDVDHAVGVWFALIAPKALSRLLEDERRSVDAIAALTTRFYLAGIGAERD